MGTADAVAGGTVAPRRVRLAASVALLVGSWCYYWGWVAAGLNAGRALAAASGAVLAAATLWSARKRRRGLRRLPSAPALGVAVVLAAFACGASVALTLVGFLTVIAVAAAAAAIRSVR